MLSDKKNCSRTENELQSLRPNYKVGVLLVFWALSVCSSIYSKYKVIVLLVF